MSRIISYPYDDSIKAKDAWVGTDEASRQTKQYTAEALAEYLNISGSISIIGQMTYKYGTTPLNGIGTLAVFGGGLDIVAFSAVVKLTLSNQDISNQRVVEFLDLLVGSDILIAEQGAISTFGYYSIDSYAINATDSNYYDLGVTFKSGNGSMRSDRIYEAQNFTLSAEENISTLQTTIDSGNTYQENETSPLWTWGSGVITVDGSGTPNGYSGIFSGKYVRLQSDLYPNYTTLANGVLVLPLPGSISSNARLFANPSMESPGEIDLLLPSTPGTLALTTDITSSPWDTVTGGINYADGNVGIGTTTPGHKLEVVGGNVHFQNTESSNTFLDVQGDDANAYIRVHSGSNSVWLYQGGSSSYLQAQAGSTLRLGSGTSNLVITNTSGEVMRISGSNVGIGTTNPSEKLHVNGNLELGTNPTLYWTSNALNLQNKSTASIPVVNIKGNVNYGARLQVEDELGLTTIRLRGNGNSYFNGGNVGIGTTSPNKKLHVNSGTINEAARFESTDVGAFIEFKDSGTTDLPIIGAVGNNFDIRTGGSTSVRVTSAGNVGIGTDSPNQKLDVNGNISIATTSGPSASNQISMVGSRAIFGYDGSISSAFMRSSDTSKPLVFGSGTSELMRIVSSTGNVGIGTTSPTGKLEVAGTTFINDGILKITQNAVTNYYASNKMHSYGTYYDWKFAGSNVMRITSAGNVGIGTTNPLTKLEIISAANEEGIAIKDSSGNLKYKVRQFGGNSYSTFWDSTNTEKVRITSGGSSFFNGGNVGIGTTSPSNKLDVNGTAYVTNLRVGSSASGEGIIRHYSTGGQGIGIVTGNLSSSGIGLYVSHDSNNRNVGIGTTSPTYKLDVNGQVLSDGYRLAAMQTAPATRNSTGTLGEIVIDGNHIYVCYATDSWSRVALDTSW